jgi:hypothetical protein
MWIAMALGRSEYDRLLRDVHDAWAVRSHQRLSVALSQIEQYTL